MVLVSGKHVNLGSGESKSCIESDDIQCETSLVSRDFILKKFKDGLILCNFYCVWSLAKNKEGVYGIVTYPILYCFTSACVGSSS